MNYPSFHLWRTPQLNLGEADFNILICKLLILQIPIPSLFLGRFGRTLQKLTDC